MTTKRERTFVRLMIMALGLLLLIYDPAAAEDHGFTAVPEEVRPGKTERYTFVSDTAGDGRAELRSEDGQVFTVFEQMNVLKGDNHLIWDGLVDGEAPAEGEYTLCAILPDGEARVALSVGAPAPVIRSADIFSVAEDGSVTLTAECSMPGTLTVTVETEDGKQTVIDETVEEGLSTFVWDGRVDGRRLQEGAYMLQFTLAGSDGFTGTRQNREMEYPFFEDETAPEQSAERSRHTVIPSRQVSQEDENSYWTLPIGVLDEEKIWEVLMQPMTVLDGDQTLVYKLRATPDKSTEKENLVGEITYASQGVHVLETLDNGWTKVEVYNSSYGPKCKSRRGVGVTNELIVGYVETKKLKTVTPVTNMGLVIDKLNQTMYIFEDGKLTGTLLVSTGLNNATQSWNETPSGEYVMISRMGGFAAGNLWCAYGMRINGGCAIHEVPYIGNKDTPSSQRDYSSTVKLLGQKASHGCIRVQKATNEAGQNIKWLWNNMKVNTKVLIWEDSGRYLDYPDDSMELYYNPNGGKYYHEAQYCTGVKERYLPLTAFTYGELENEPYASLTPCANCCHTKRKAEIDQLNAENGF